MAALEHYWYRNSPLHLILLPVSWLFGMLCALRRTLYRGHILKSYALPVPVVVIGNISVGGTGKTPLTLAIAQQLIDCGRRPVIISRGFGGTTEQQPVTSSSTAQQTGDEPLLMAGRGICPVWVGRDRVATARLALQSHPQCDVVLCDDGLQHYRLQRDMEIAVVDGVRRFGNGHLLPAGPLREPVSRLKSVDAVVVNGGSAAPGQYAMHLSGEIFYNLTDPSLTATARDLQHLRLHAVAGIGHPQRFFDHLTSLGLTVTPHAFPDHHPYLESDLCFDECDALLLTEKDAVKCTPFADESFRVLRVDALIDPALIAHILRKIALHGRKTA
ncbi:MAG: tetraacyldisaccharide 4'-kinase [Gallionella sp.]|jgi:tetraacyldisaccharide 4'-kinase